MARAHLDRMLVDKSDPGNVVLITDATVRVYKPETTTLVTDTMYTTRTGPTTRTQAWNPTDGQVDFYMDYAQTVRLGITVDAVETFIENIDVGAPYGDDNILTYGCRPIPGFDNYDALTEAFTGTMTAYSGRYVPVGVFDTSQTILLPTDLDGWCIKGFGPGGTNRLGPSVIRAKSSLAVGALDGLVGPLEWWTNGATEDTGQGQAIMWLGFDGNGFDDARNITTAIETTAKALHGLVIHGSGMKVIDCMSVSANGHGLTQTHFGRDGTTPIGESHETAIRSCGARWTGLSGIHTGEGQQDGTVEGWSKTQYNGEHGISHEDGAGWSDINTHPSYAAKSLIHVDTGAWNYRAALNYAGSVGEFMDGAAVTHYGIRIRSGPALILGNKINTNSVGGQVDPVRGLYWHGLDGENGVIDVSHNSIICQTTDDDVEISQKNGVTEPPSVDEHNVKVVHTP